MDQVLDVVRSSLTESKPPFLPTEEEAGESRDNVGPSQNASGHDNRPGWGEVEADGERFDDVFDDFGAGAGVEGDLEMGDENEDGGCKNHRIQRKPSDAVIAVIVIWGSWMEGV